MTDEAQRAAWALQQFQSFVDHWTAPATRQYLKADIQHVKDTIRAINRMTVRKWLGK
jgi:hypothetical protein